VDTVCTSGIMAACEGVSDDLCVCDLNLALMEQIGASGEAALRSCVSYQPWQPVAPEVCGDQQLGLDVAWRFDDIGTFEGRILVVE